MGNLNYSINLFVINYDNLIILVGWHFNAKFVKSILLTNFALYVKRCEAHLDLG